MTGGGAGCAADVEIEATVFGLGKVQYNQGQCTARPLRA